MTERNNRQLSEISGAKLEEIALKHFPDYKRDSRHNRGYLLGDDTLVIDCSDDRERCVTALLELQRETQRETLLEAAKDAKAMNCGFCGEALAIKFIQKAAELGAEGKGD